jgi:hypothetical protein
MTAAADAMSRAVTSLDALKTNDALPPEMQALNQLLKAQAEIKRRQISTNQSAAGAANTNRNYDLSTLFDRELQRQQQTSYETPSTAGRQPPAGSDALDRIKELAKRQDELLRRQQSLARAQVTEDQRQRELEQLTREQTELRQRAEELARQMAESSSTGNSQPATARNSSGSSGQQGRMTRGGNDGSRQGQMRDVSEAMRQAAGDLRRGSPERAGTNASRALEKLRDLERRLQPSRPDDKKRAAGEMQLEAKQLADGQRQIASELGKLQSGEADKDALRRNSLLPGFLS